MSKRDLKAIIPGCIVAVLILCYFGIAFYFDQVFCPNTSINGMDVSYMKPEDVRAALEDVPKDYELQITEIDGNTETLDGKSFKFACVYDSVEELKIQEMGWMWPMKFFTQTDYEVGPAYTCDETMLDKAIDQLACMTQEMIAPVNASLKIDDSGFYLSEETVGNTLKEDKVHQVIKDAVLLGQAEVNLEDMGCYEKPEITMESPEIRDELKKVDELCDAEITLDFHGTEEKIGTEQIRQWVRRDKEGELYVSWDAAYDYLYRFAEKYDTINSYREFETSHGWTVTLNPGNYGWGMSVYTETNLVLDDIANHRVVEREASYYMTPYDYLDPNSPDDIGFTYIEIDLSGQHMWYYMDGELFLDTPITSGTMSTGHGTPSGVYYIYNRLRNVTLKGEDYEQPVDYWMQVNGGIGIHDSKWRSVYGGTEYLNHGSHGCINTPYWAVESIFNNVTIGTPVILYY